MAADITARVARAAVALDVFLADTRRETGAPAVPHASAGAPPSVSGAANPARTRSRAFSGGAEPENAAPAQPARANAGMQLPQPDWLPHEFAVRGPAEIVVRFRAAASGAGLIPWQHDFDRLEEDWFYRLIAPAQRTLSIGACRVLARQLRDAAERRHGLALVAVGRSHACPFDLHAVVPVPLTILRLGSDHPNAVFWLWRHWGTTQPLRHVHEVVAARERAGGVSGESHFRIDFWAADWTPWRALQRLRADWPALRFDLQPRYDLT